MEHKNWEWKKYIRAAVIVLLIEIFLWNHSFWISMGNKPIVLDGIYTQTDEFLLLPGSYLVEKDSCLEIRDIDRHIKNIYLNIETDKEIKKDTLDIKLGMVDEGRKSYYDSANRTISCRLQKLNYISLYPYGDLKSLRISFPNDMNTLITVRDVVLNPRVPMFFSFWRVLIMYFTYLVVRTLFFKPYEAYYQPSSRPQRWTAAGICAILCIAIFLLAKEGDSDIAYSMDKYTDLTHSLAKGMVYLDTSVDERLLAAENPYDGTERTELGIPEYRWDYAYYNGRLYVYFGVVPVLLTYLPYYMLTGKDLPHITPYMIFLLGVVTGAWMFMNAMVRRYCKKMPLKLYYLFLVTFSLGIGTMIFVKRLNIYNLAIMSGVCLTLWGMYFWVSSEDKPGHNTVWKVFLGSLCMALVAGCRPQIVMGSFLAFPIFGKKIKRMFAEFKNKKNLKEHILFLSAFCIPYFVVAGCLMWYNYERFGSPFDFGANYNLTTNDMRFRGIHIARMIGGLWSMLFKLPVINTEFPYLSSTWFNTMYQGITIQENGIGGIFMTNIILLPVFFIYRYRARLREKQLLSFSAISMLNGIIIVCADVQASGILVRYLADSLLFFYLASFAVIFTFIDRCYEKENAHTNIISRNVWCRGAALLCVMTVAYWCMTIFILYEVPDYNVGNALWYNRLRVIFGVFDV